MKYRQMNKKRFLLLSVVVFVICGMALGYTALSSSFKINGTGTISTNWDILFTSIEEKSSKGAVTNHKEITDKLTAAFDVNIEAPGNFIEYNVVIKNNGNMDAVIESIEGIVEANGQEPTGIKFRINGLRIGDDLLAGSEKTFVVRAEIPMSETTLPTGTKTLDLKVNVRQKDIDSSGLVTTFKDCFQTSETGDTITNYLCGKNNTNGYSEILDVTIPREIDGKVITQIGYQAFFGRGLTSVVLPDTVTSIAIQAFASNQLQTIRIPDSVKIISAHAFVNNKLTEIMIPSTVTTLGDSVFRINLMDDSEAFIYNRNSDGTENKSSLNSYAGRNRDHIIIPEQVTTIGPFTFSGIKCKSVVFSGGLKTIAKEAFRNNLLTNLELPSALNSLQQSAFEGNQLTNVEFKGLVPVTLERSIFKSNPGLTINTIKVPIGTLEQYKNAQGKVDNILQSSSQTWFGSDDTGLLDAFYE